MIINKLKQLKCKHSWVPLEKLNKNIDYYRVDSYCPLCEKRKYVEYDELVKSNEGVHLNCSHVWEQLSGGRRDGKYIVLGYCPKCKKEMSFTEPRFNEILKRQEIDKKYIEYAKYTSTCENWSDF